MALWQYPLTVLPRAGVVAHFGYMPERLPPSWPSETKPVALPDWWAGQRVAAAPLLVSFDALLPRAAWGDSRDVSWKGNEANQQDHDCYLGLDTEGNFVEEFQFRTDLRAPAQAAPFLKAVLTLCQQQDLVLLDATGTLLPPQLSELLPFIEQSRAVRFLTNPQAFLEQVLREQPGS
jgi:hypothetical protein